MPALRNSGVRPSFDRPLGAVLAGALLVSAGAMFYFHAQGSILYYGDAQAHLNIARRLWDSRTPGWNQSGTVWLPLPHLLTLPFTLSDWLWQTGLAGAVPSAGCFIAACLFLFGATRRALESQAAGLGAAALFALNPNLLYLQSTAMSEPVFFASLSALLYYSVRFGRKPSPGAAAGAGVAALAATMTRYEGWFVLPFVVGYFLVTGRQFRLRLVLLFSVIAFLGPAFWLAHNWWYFGDALEFFRGPYSASAIQGARSYPGYGDFREAWLYFRSAAALCCGSGLLWLALAGTAAALTRRAFWPVALLALAPAFYVWSIHSSRTPVFVPNLWPHSYYNTRYGLALLPLAAFLTAALVSVFPKRIQAWVAFGLVVVGAGPWLARLEPQEWVTWKESQVNSEARRAWTQEASAYLRRHYQPGSGILTNFGDMTGIFSSAGIALRETLTGDNMPQWEATVVRPDLFLWEEWAVATRGDRVESAVTRPGLQFERKLTIIVKGAQPIDIYRRARSHNANTIYQGAR